MDQAAGRKIAYSTTWFRYWMPYCFQKLEVKGRKHVYLPLNRNYKPLGITSRDHVNYAKYLDQAIVFGSDPKKFSGIWNGDISGDKLWLYEDATPTRLDYFERLGKLLSKAPKIAGPLGDE